MTRRRNADTARRALAVAQAWLWTAVLVGSVVLAAGASAGLASAADWWTAGGAH